MKNFIPLIISVLSIILLGYLCLKGGNSAASVDDIRRRNYVPKRDDKETANISLAQRAGNFDINSVKWEGSAIHVGAESSNWSSKGTTEYAQSNISVDTDTSRTFYPSSRVSSGEKILRDLVAQKFPEERVEYNVRYKGIENPKTGARLEFDVYLPDRKIAFEFNGQQHYEQTGFPENYRDQVDRDRAKSIACARAGIALITLTYRENTKEKQWRVIEPILNNMGIYLK